MFSYLLLIRVATLWQKLPTEMDKLFKARPQAWQLWRRWRGFNHQASCSPWEQVQYHLFIAILV